MDKQAARDALRNLREMVEKEYARTSLGVLGAPAHLHAQSATPDDVKKWRENEKRVSADWREQYTANIKALEDTGFPVPSHWRQPTNAREQIKELHAYEVQLT